MDMRLLKTLSVFLLIAGAQTVTAADRKNTQLTGCASASAPFVKMTGGFGVGGFSVELLDQIARQLNRTARVLEMPWARCLDQVMRGKVDVAVDAYEDPGRKRIYWYSRPYYTLTPQVYFRKGTLGMPATSVEELRKFKGCGVREYTYDHYQIEASTMDLGASNDLQMLEKLARSRCDYALEEKEYITGGRAHEGNWPDENLFQSYQPDWAKGPQLHFLIGKDRVDGKTLQKQIDQAILSLEKRGVIATLSRKYLQARPQSSPR